MRRIKRKPLVYTGILVGIILATFLISYVTGVDTTNTWLSLLFVNAFFLTIAIMLFDLAKSVETPRAITRYIVYFFPILVLLLLVISNIAFFMGAFN